MLVGGRGAERGRSQPCLPHGRGNGALPRPSSHQKGSLGQPFHKNCNAGDRVSQPRDPACAACCAKVPTAAFVWGAWAWRGTCGADC